ncbi:SEC-C metal-binding domain-containing protein [Pendulispora brunnea]|uniref:SEC-C metal-binding domain-containing protein n=1 Tax=Pendulispora brunnea TaxID=2905690 RepID=UPI00374E1914
MRPHGSRDQLGRPCKAWVLPILAQFARRSAIVRELAPRIAGASSAAIEWRCARVGRNDPCPCGSEKKYKKCCGAR